MRSFPQPRVQAGRAQCHNTERKRPVSRAFFCLAWDPRCAARRCWTAMAQAVPSAKGGYSTPWPVLIVALASANCLAPQVT